MTCERVWPIERSKVADIHNVHVPPGLPDGERVVEFVRQMNGDPYHCTCNGFFFTFIYPPDGDKMANCVMRTVVL